MSRGNGSSTERPEIGGVSVLPVVPELIDHLGERICKKAKLPGFVSLTAWCIINKGSNRMSEPWIWDVHQSKTHHWGSTWGRVRNQQERLRGRTLGNPCGGSVSGKIHNTFGRLTHPPTM